MADIPQSTDADLPEEQFPTVVHDGRESGAGPVVAPAGTTHFPRTIGRYRILGLLGQGGMGAVYKAEQDQPRRLVALKVIRAAIAPPDLIRRFEIEGEALGRLHHPAIAQIYDAGKVDTGAGFQPYFAMELILGHPLTEYATRNKLHLKQRLALIIRICEGIEHAHQRGIIHRDLKPSNILVDETGQPKILDFGLARLSGVDSGVSRQTDMGQLLGTLAYMSPEQVRADPAAIDARTDVYAIGMILYELLAAKLPYQLTRHLSEVMQTIQMTEPGRLSKVDSAYRGDIETIAAKALEKDKTRRYSSAAELAADIRRYLDDEPIVARPASAAYQLEKFVRRNKALVAGTVAVFVALSFGVVVSLAQAARARAAERAAIEQRDQVLVAERRASAERDRALTAEASAKEERDRAVAAESQAEREKTRAEQEKSAALLEKQRANAINDFLQNDLLSQASAMTQSEEETEPDPDLKVRTALDRAAAKIPGKFDRQPEVEAAVRKTIGRTYFDLGRFQEAAAQLEKVFEYSRQIRGPSHPETLEAELQLASAFWRDGRFPRAEVLFREVLDARRRLLGPGHPDTMRALSGLAALLDSSGKEAEAEGLLLQGYETLNRALGPEHPDTLTAMTNLADVYRAEAKYQKAETLFVRVLEVRQRLLGPTHPSTLDSMNHVAAIKRSLGDYAGAEQLHREVLSIKSRVLGPEHPDTLQSMNSLAGAYNRQGKYAQGEALHRQAYEIRRRVLGPDHPSTLQSLNNLAITYLAQGKRDQSTPLLEQVVELRRKVLGPEHPKTLRSIHNLATSYSGQGKYAEAQALFEQVLAAQRRLSGPDHPDTLSSMEDLAEVYRLLGRTAEAEAIYKQVLDADGRVFGPNHPRTKATKRALEAVSVRRRTP